MKKYRVSAILLLAIAFLLVLCKDGGGEVNPFVGTWEDRDDDVIEQFIFTKDFKVTRTVQALSPENEAWNQTNIGTYQYDDSTIIFDYKSPENVYTRANYIFFGNYLTMYFQYYTYTYKKIK